MVLPVILVYVYPKNQLKGLLCVSAVKKSRLADFKNFRRSMVSREVMPQQVTERDTRANTVVDVCGYVTRLYVGPRRRL